MEIVPACVWSPLMAIVAIKGETVTPKHLHRRHKCMDREYTMTWFQRYGEGIEQCLLQMSVRNKKDLWSLLHQLGSHHQLSMSTQQLSR